MVTTSLNADQVPAAKSIAVVGGGQLAQMLVKAAKLRNIEVNVITSSKEDPAVQESKTNLVLTPDNLSHQIGILKDCQGITFENEWIDISHYYQLEECGVDFYPRLSSLHPLINKIKQRQMICDLNLPCPDWLPLSSEHIGENKLPNGWEFPLMAKLAKGGYDGKGTKKINNYDELNELLNVVDISSWLIEKWVSYDSELSLVLSRDNKGKIRSFPLVETTQVNQVCDWVLAPADYSHHVEAMAYNIAASLLSHLNYVGVMAIEYFYGPKGLLINEIAPRTHNSAHFSIDSCSSSQFDQQLCISAGLDLPEIEMLSEGALMVNLLGLSDNTSSPLDQRISRIKSLKGAILHWYNKSMEKPGRKLGHVNFLLKEKSSERRKNEAMEYLHQVRSIWPTI